MNASIDEHVAGQVPELEEGLRDLLSFADFCEFLAGDDVADQAAALRQLAAGLVGATSQRLGDADSGAGPAGTARRVPGPRSG